MFTTGLLDTVAAKCPSGICRAEGVVISPVVPKSEALAALTANANTSQSNDQGYTASGETNQCFPHFHRTLTKAANAALNCSYRRKSHTAHFDPIASILFWSQKAKKAAVAAAFAISSP